MPKQKPPSRRFRWAAYVCDLKNHLHLRDWQIAISEEQPAGDNSIASIEPIYGRKFATLRMSEGFLNDPPSEQTHTLIHELLHCHLAPLQRLIEANNEMTPGYKMAIEYAVDGLADAIAPLLPEPPSATRSQH
jgi:hypothetical protein